MPLRVVSVPRTPECINDSMPNTTLVIGLILVLLGCLYGLPIWAAYTFYERGPPPVMFPTLKFLALGPLCLTAMPADVLLRVGGELARQIQLRTYVSMATFRIGVRRTTTSTFLFLHILQASYEEAPDARPLLRVFICVVVSRAGTYHGINHPFLNCRWIPGVLRILRLWPAAASDPTAL
ncbi:hypothetical protein DFH06DRAFT_1360555 [Mycena polygramma]|nr:hypothetical protein DFH06DRAFT_1360555 [Mycena polygramma]